MENLYFNGQPCHTYGTVPSVGETAPDFTLTGVNLDPVKLSDYKGKQVVLNIFPSLDTAVCARSVRRFNEDASKLEDTVVLCISEDLPFAMARFCTLEGLNDVIPASAFRSPEFVEKYGVQLIDGPLKGLLARVVLIVDKEGKIIYRDVVEEITHDPDYDAAMKVLQGKY